MRFGKLERPNTLVYQSAQPRLFAKLIQVSPNELFRKRAATDFGVVAKIDAVQAEYSAFETVHETDDLIEAAKELDVAYVAYSPLGHGWLVDEFPYKTPDDFAPNDFRRSSPKFQGENFYKNKAIVEEIQKLASRRGCKVTQIALAWVIAQGMIPIPGTTKAHRLEENWVCRDIELTDEEKQEMRKIIDAAKPQGERYGAAGQAMVGH